MSGLKRGSLSMLWESRKGPETQKCRGGRASEAGCQGSSRGALNARMKLYLLPENQGAAQGFRTGKVSRSSPGHVG